MALTQAPLGLALLASYSGSDIAVVVRDALMQPVRKVLSATHFKPVQPDPDSAIIKWTPCSPGDPDAVEKNWTQVESDELQEPPLRFTDFVKSLESVRPTVSEEDIRKHDEWTKESGTSCGLCNLSLWFNDFRQGLMVHDDYA
jgi:vacuolar protein-sorting-associated protein 4